MPDLREQEYIAFQRLFNALGEAIGAVDTIGVIRSDQRWAKISANMQMARELAYKLAGTGFTKK